MPCQSYFPEQHIDELIDEKTSMKQELDRVTQFLCYLCGQAELEDKIKETPEPIQAWWILHKKHDAVRVEKAMLEALSVFQDFPNNAPSASDLAELFIARARQVHPLSDYHVDWFAEMADKAVALFKHEATHER